MSDLTAADLARLDHLRRRADEGEYEAAALQAIANHFSVPALIATVRELARAIVAAHEDGRLSWGDPGCPFCAGEWSSAGRRVVHAPDCIVIRARALAGE